MKTIKQTCFALLVAPLALAPLAALGQNVEIPVGSQAKEKRSIDRPVAGMLKSQVESIYGQPQSTKAPVGDPPISSWTYDDFVVYFEYDHVVHTVLRTDATAARPTADTGGQ